MAGTIEEQRKFVLRYINAQGHHMSDSWKDGFAEVFGFVEDQGNPYLPLIEPKGTKRMYTIEEARADLEKAIRTRRRPFADIGPDLSWLEAVITNDPMIVIEATDDFPSVFEDDWSGVPEAYGTSLGYAWLGWRIGFQDLRKGRVESP
jgi:hypothetical protein